MDTVFSIPGNPNKTPISSPSKRMKSASTLNNTTAKNFYKDNIVEVPESL